MYADRIGAHRERESGIDFLTGRDLTLPTKVFIDKATVFPDWKTLHPMDSHHAVRNLTGVFKCRFGSYSAIVRPAVQETTTSEKK